VPHAAAFPNVGSSFTLLLMEFEIRQFFSAFSRIRWARSRSLGCQTTSVGLTMTSVICKPTSSTLSNLPTALQSKLTNSSCDISAMARNVIMKQELTDTQPLPYWRVTATNQDRQLWAKTRACGSFAPADVFGVLPVRGSCLERQLLQLNVR
jgi:hypothetical protein